MYCFRCPRCNATAESVSPQKPICPDCGAMMRRDWKAESAKPLYHPSKGR